MWKCHSTAFDTRTPVVMGILNVTPDSFSDGGEHNSFDAAIEAAVKMHDEGALIIDVGGESTRPGAASVTEQEELDRVLDVVRELASRDMCVSIDTRHAPVAQACVDAGASIINDVSGFRDPRMVEVAAGCDAGLVVMHMKGTPEHMQDRTDYTDVVSEVSDYLAQQAHMLEDAGVDHDRICIDAGPGFGKTAHQTMELMRNTQELVRLGYPVMAAVSRKSYIGALYHIDEPRDRDDASAHESLLACEQGASIVRAHNVEKTVAALADLRPRVLLGLGCNVSLIQTKQGEEREAEIAQLQKAIADMCGLPDTIIVNVSHFYESEPAYVTDQALFVNAVAEIRTGLPPRELLQYLHTIEDSLGRVRTTPNGPRTCDIDILDYQCYACDDDELTLPHPLIGERDFVVKPLLEIQPNYVLSDGTSVVTDTVKVGKAHRI
ncbi:MAG: dihydropteroate synthase [Eggerthellaceae bacterium]|jgi:dihydropteroate synthase|nr:dihydropteroate synthase [Eggerthellaceae bacterium]MCH4220852.1 dihydropteroate synthase [Eggerthellaceae bacterium]